MHAHLLIAAASLSGVLVAQDPEENRGDRLVRVELLCDRDAVRAGEEFTLAVRLRVEPGWHIYWENPGDSGFPTRAEIRGPAGFEIGPVRFPAPERHDSEGEIVTFVHTGDVVLLAPVRAPAKLEPSSKPRFEVDCRWLVCIEACYPGSGKAAVEVPLAEAERKPRPANEKLFADARARLPRPWKDLAGATLDWTRDEECSSLALSVAGATALDFFPTPSESTSLGSVVRTQDERGSRLTLCFRFRPTSPDETLVARGVLRVKTARGEACYDLAAPFEPSAKSPRAKK